MADPPTIPGRSGRKLLGVPLLYWAAIGVLILAYVAYRTHTASTTPATDPTLTDTTATDPTATSDTFTAQPTPTYDPSLGATTTVETNDSWAKKATEWAALSGLAGAGDAQLAIQKYLNGDQLTFEEGKIRDAVIHQFGAPPEPITVGGTSAEAGKRQGTPPNYHTVKGPNDNDYPKLIGLYWGASSDERLRLIQAANQSLGASGPFPVGTRVFIPKYHVPKYYTSTKTINTLGKIAAHNGTSVAALRILNANLKDTLPIGTRVRVA